MEGDRFRLWLLYIMGISIHSLRMEGDSTMQLSLDKDGIFQSTPSAWRETVTTQSYFGIKYISIHSLRMEGDWNHSEKAGKCRSISIHSLRMEGDCSVCRSLEYLPYFNPLPPHGGRLKD